MYAYGKNLVALKMSFHNIGAIVQDAQSSCKRQDAAFAATRPAYKQCMLIFQSDLVLPISVQILHISHSLPVSTPRISTNHKLQQKIRHHYITDINSSVSKLYNITIINQQPIQYIFLNDLTIHICDILRKSLLKFSLTYPINLS